MDKRLPEEIVYQIFSYLPIKILVDLRLSNREYWEIYRLRVKKTPWNNTTIWIDQMLKTNEMILSENSGLYVHSLYSLEYGDPSDTYTQKIPVKNGLVTFEWLEEEIGYVWRPLDVSFNLADVKQVLNTKDTTAPPFGVDVTCSSKLLKIFNKYIFEHATSCLNDQPGWVREDWRDYNYLIEDFNAIRCNVGRDPKWISPRNNSRHIKKNFRKFPGSFEMPLVLYLKENYLDLKETDGNPELVDYEIDFVDEDKDSDCYVIWKVLKNKKDIGRAVLSVALHSMVDKRIPGVALFADENNLVYGFGNFSIFENNVINKSTVFTKPNFAIVKENIYNDSPVSQWLKDIRSSNKIVKIAVKDSRKKKPASKKYPKIEPLTMRKVVT